jgi:UPF0716 protein FxsA
VPLLALIAIFVVVPLAELYVIFKVGDAIGILPTLAILVADSILGSMLLKSQGRAVWRRFNESMSAGRIPHREVLDGALVIFGGALLLTPGFVTDILGIILLLPPTRVLVRQIVARRVLPRLVVSRFGGGFGSSPPGGNGGPRRRPGGGSDVEGTATEIDPPQLR